jgi:hypothetical protein
MINEFFYWVVNISIIATVAGLIVYCIGLINRIPRSVTYTLWIAVFVRFALPFMFSSKLSVMNLLTVLGSKTITVYDNIIPYYPSVSLGTANSIQLADSYFPLIYKAETSNVLIGVF